MDEDNTNFECNLSGFTLSVLHAACSETESDAVSVQQTKDTETASEEEREAFFGDVRTKEFERLTATMKEQNDEAGNTETASEEGRFAFFGDVRTKEFDCLTATLDQQVDKAENHDVQAKPMIMKKESLQNQVETETIDTEETASEEERVAFFQSVKDAERKKLVEAFEREQVWKKEREERRTKKRQEQIRKMFEEFHKPAVSPLSASYLSPAQEPGPSNEHYHQYPSSSNTEYNIMLKASVSKLHERVQAFAEEQKDLQRKLEQSHATKPRADTEENKENIKLKIVIIWSYAKYISKFESHFNHILKYPSSSNTEYNIMLKASVSKLHERVQAFAEEQKDLQRKLEQSHATKPRADTEENKENSKFIIRYF
ncbi:unnamed protein product [Mytilus coruscus]|uniref:Uncharacterized protein n=1 Tax=Mytilus coruscus TaxID=42192 RepID=A0A6J8E616_MYTCO|nr:unnamed protein product [Mytilus coruscus]